MIDIQKYDHRNYALHITCGSLIIDFGHWSLTADVTGWLKELIEKYRDNGNGEQENKTKRRDSD